MTRRTYQPDLAPAGRGNYADEMTFKVTLVYGNGFLASSKGKHVTAQKTATGKVKLTIPRSFRQRVGFKWGWGKYGAGAVLFPVVGDDDSTTTGEIVIETRTEAGVATNPADGAELDLEFAFSLNSLNDDAERTPPAPILSSVSPATDVEEGGATITFTGENFSQGATVFFGATEVATTYVSPTSITALAPATAAGVGGLDVDVHVENPDGQVSNTLEDGFEFTDTP